MLNMERYGLTALFCLLFFSIPTSALASGIPQDGLIVEYLFDDSVSPGKDSSPNTKHATVNGSPTLTTGKIGQALHINEFSDVLENVPSFAKGQTTSFNLWFKTTKGGKLLQQSYWTGNSTPLWEMIPAVRAEDGRLEVWAFGLLPGKRDDFLLPHASTDYRDGQWHMLTIITDGVSGKAYIDGQLYGEDTTSIGAGGGNIMTKVGGACQYAHDNCSQGKLIFDGQLDNYRMYNRALTEAEVTQLFNETLQVQNQAPVAQADNFDLKDTDGLTELDILTNDQDEEKASLAITITNQSGVGGSATVVDQKLSYTPQTGYIGEDWVEYRLTDKQGLTSEVVRVTISITVELLANIVRDGLIAEYLFENPNHPGKDTSPNAKHATVNGSPTLTTGKIGQALHIDEFSDVLENVPSFAKGQTTSFNLWFKTTKGGKLLQQSYWTGNSTPLWEMIPAVRAEDGRLEVWAFGLLPGKRDDFLLPHASTDYRDGQWHMLTIITDGVSGKAYIDGQLYGEDTTSIGAGGGNIMTKVGGACQYAHDNCSQGKLIFDGQLDNYRMYNRALNESEIQQLYQEAPGNQAPIATADVLSVISGTSSTELDILANDTDEDKSSLVIAITAQGEAGGIATVTGQKLSYNSPQGYLGEDWIEYKITDKQGVSSQVTRVVIHSIKEYLPTVNISGLVAEYLFEDPAQPGKDTSSNAKHATVNGSPTLATGKVGQALVIDEFSDVLENVPSFAKGQTTSFNLWFKTTKGGKLLQQSYWTGNSTPLWEMIPAVRAEDGRLEVWAFGLLPGRRDDFLLPHASTDYRDGQWHMLTIITDGVSGKAYIDGQLYGEDTTSIGAGGGNIMTKVGGACQYAHDNCSQGKLIFDGQLDNYRMYNRALTEAEITQLLNETPQAPNQAPVAQADKFDVVNTAGVAELNILNNDSDEDKASLVVTITNQGGLGGTTTISGQTLKYTPQTDYIGQDWFEYQLTDKHGLKSDITRVTLDVQKYKPRAGIATVSPRQNFIDEDKRLITITHDTPGAKVWFQFHNLETGTITDYIEYTNPFYLYDSARIITIVKGEDYLDGPLTSKDYVMCKQDSCGRTPYQKQLEWRDEQTQRVVTKAKVNQPVRLWWDIEYVRYCEESTPGHTVKKTRTPNGKTPAYTFTQSGSVESSWQCFNSHRKQTFPTLTGNDYRTLPLQVEKLDAPTTLTHKQQGVTMTLNWDKVNYASHYQLQYQKDGGTWQTTTVNGQTTQLPFTQGTYHFRLSACIPTTCDNVSQVLTKTINVTESSFIVHTLEWENAPITVGQTPKLIWNIEHAVQCTIQGQTYSHNQHHTFPVSYQPTVIKPVLTCNKTTGGTHEAISIPESLWLQVNKLSAPANLHKQ